MWRRAANLLGLSLFVFWWTKCTRGLQLNAPSETSFACNPVWELIHAPAPLFTVSSSISAGKKLQRLTWFWVLLQKFSYSFIACWRSFFCEFMLQKSNPWWLWCFRQARAWDKRGLVSPMALEHSQPWLLCPPAFSVSDNSFGLCRLFPPSLAWQTQLCFL